MYDKLNAYPAGAAGTVASTTPLSPIQIVGQTLDAADWLAARCISLAERLVGPIPTAERADTKQGGSGVFGALTEIASRTSGQIEEAHNALSRIEQALP
ncbi:MAG: hypothetical protein AB7S41_08935 [Parvibaculaceae bacterium]